MIKVLYIVHSCVPYGANVALINLIDSLVDYGVQPYVVCAEEGALLTWLDERGIEHFRIPFQMSSYPKIYDFKSYITFLPRLLRNVSLNFLARIRLLRLVRRLNPDLIHTNIGPVKIGYDVARITGTPHFWHVREYQKLDFGIHFFPSVSCYKRSLKHSNVICITKDLRRHFELEEAARVIYDGVMARSEAAADEAKSDYILFVGRLEKAKGILPLIESYASYVRKGGTLKLLVAGTGLDEYEKMLRSRVEDLSLGDRVVFLGFRSDRFDLMKRAVALIVPSINEGFGFISVEAMFNGCLLVGRNTGGTKEIMENSQGRALSFIGDEDMADCIM